jgi:hypothetical protein
MNYEDFLPIYPEITTPNFQQQILNKKEFYELKLTKQVESVAQGDFLNHQKIIRRFMNPNALYDELLLYHETGTGKSGVAFAVTEQLYDSQSFSKVLIFARGKPHLTALMKELVYKFSKRYTIPENIEEERKIRYMKKATSDFYQFHTFETFSRKLKDISDDQIQERYSNMVFIIDEVHHFKSDNDANIYKQFHRLIHQTNNRKVLLMSGTPMRDDVSEISYIMNLIIPLDQQLPVGKDFVEKYIDRETKQILNSNELKKYMKGRISFLSSSPVDTRSKYIGTYISPLKIEQFKIFTTMMTSPQLEGYIDAYNKDLGKEGSIYTRTRQASMFVFPDGSYGKDAVKEYTTKSGSIRVDLFEDLNTIDGLAKYSSKYAFVLKNILDNPKKLVYVYSSSVTGSGIEMFSKILNYYGFNQATGKEKRPGKRFIVLSSEEKADVDTPLSFFNRPENRYGEYCQIIIGSRMVSESFTFKNIQIVHILTLHWNYTETQQATARAIRYGSHNDLIADGLIPVVEIYQHASILPTENKEVKSIDVLMLETAQEKDILIRKMDRIIKEISFDCPLTFERNYRNTGSDTRDCDYQMCEYKCDDSSLEQTIEDLSTYRLYYQNDQDILKQLREIYSKYFTLQFSSIQDIIQVDSGVLVKVLSDCVRFNVGFINKYGIKSYLREENDRYYLVDNICLPNHHQELEYYAQHPFITKRTSLKQLTNEHIYAHNLQQFSKFSQSNTIEEAKIHLDNLPIQIQELVLETAIAQKLVNKQTNTYTKFVEKIYEKNLSKKGKIIYSDLLTPRIRCLNPEEKEWKDCVSKPIEQKEEMEVKVDVENNPYGYYGILEEDRFCIRDIRNAIDSKNGKIDKRKIKTGSNCLEVGFNKDRLAEICIELEIGVNEPLSDNPRVVLEKTASGRKLLEKWKDWSPEKIALGLYWYKKQKKETCGVLKEWFASKGLLVQEKCGQSGKVKENLRTI